MRLEFRLAIVTASICALLACGGGGDSTSPAQVTLFNVDAAFTNALGGAALTGLTATDASGGRYTASLAYTALPDGSFSGSPARRSLQTATIGRVGGPSTVSAITVYFATGPARLFATSADDGRTTVFSQIQQLPTSAGVGRSGTFALGTLYDSPALVVPVGTETLLWSVEPDSAVTALACLTSVLRTSEAISTEKDCFRIDGAGNISGGTISVDRPGIALSFSR